MNDKANNVNDKGVVDKVIDKVMPTKAKPKKRIIPKDKRQDVFFYATKNSPLQSTILVSGEKKTYPCNAAHKLDVTKLDLLPVELQSLFAKIKLPAFGKLAYTPSHKGTFGVSSTKTKAWKAILCMHGVHGKALKLTFNNSLHGLHSDRAQKLLTKQKGFVVENMGSYCFVSFAKDNAKDMQGYIKTILGTDTIE